MEGPIRDGRSEPDPEPDPNRDPWSGTSFAAPVLAAEIAAAIHGDARSRSTRIEQVRTRAKDALSSVLATPETTPARPDPT